MNLKIKSLNLHKKIKGKLFTELKIKDINKETLSLLYSPGVAFPCTEIKNNNQNIYQYTMKANTVAVITNGTAVLGLGNIGADASLPVMEGKCMLIKSMADINAFPVCIDEMDPDKFIDIVTKITSPFGAINLEDIKAPECVYIEEQLQKKLNIPVFHDDQHGTAIVCLAALINACKVANKDIKNIKILISGSGAAGSAICKLLLAYGCKNIVILNKFGILKPNNSTNTWLDDDLAKLTKGKDYLENDLKHAIKNQDVFIGVSAPDILTVDMVKSMNDKAIIFAMANPNPEITYKKAIEAKAFIYGSGRSDTINQINNLLAFPGLLKACLKFNLKTITTNMKLSVAIAIASYISENKLSKENIIPKSLDKKIVNVVVQGINKTLKNNKNM